MANLVMAGGADGFHTSIFGTQHPGTLAFIERSLSDATSTLTEAGQRFMAGARELYERFSSSEAMRLMRAAARAAQHLGQSNTIRFLADIGALQQAPPVMHRYIMAEPTVRKLYHEDRCEGYAGMYDDVSPGDVGESHYDYRRVMQNMVTFESDGGWTATTWGEDLHDGDYELSFEEKCDMLDSWWAVREYLKAGGEDPTSRFNAELG